MIGYKELSNMSSDELKSLNRMIVDIFNERKAQKAWETKHTLKVGQVVKVNHPKLMGHNLTVTKINRTKAVLQLQKGVTYTVPLSLIITYNGIK